VIKRLYHLIDASGLEKSMRRYWRSKFVPMFNVITTPLPNAARSQSLCLKSTYSLESTDVLNEEDRICNGVRGLKAHWMSWHLRLGESQAAGLYRRDKMKILEVPLVIVLSLGYLPRLHEAVPSPFRVERDTWPVMVTPIRPYYALRQSHLASASASATIRLAFSSTISS
jgi:hypothetical protein